MDKQQTTKQPQERLKSRSKHVWLWTIGSFVALLLILFFVNEDLFSQVLAWLLMIGLPTISILVIISPFLIIWKSKFKFNTLNIIISLAVSGVLIYLIYKGWIFFFNYMFEAIGEGFLSSF